VKLKIGVVCGVIIFLECVVSQKLVSFQFLEIRTVVKKSNRNVRFPKLNRYKNKEQKLFAMFRFHSSNDDDDDDDDDETTISLSSTRRLCLQQSYDW